MCGVRWRTHLGPQHATPRDHARREPRTVRQHRGHPRTGWNSTHAHGRSLANGRRRTRTTARAGFSRRLQWSVEARSKSEHGVTSVRSRLHCAVSDRCRRVYDLTAFGPINFLSQRLTDVYLLRSLFFLSKFRAF